MTSDAGAAVVAHTFVKRGRRYIVDGQPVLSVTTALGEGWPKPGLKIWAARRTAGIAVDRWDELSELSPSRRLDELRGAVWKERDTSALNGTQYHALGEALVHGQPVDVTPEQRETVEAYARFLDAWQVEPTHTETPLCHFDHGWAGTPDLRAIVRGGSDVLLDLKTGADVYEDMALQLTAYSRAQVWLDDDGAMHEWTRPEACLLVHVRGGSVELRRVDDSERTYRLFRYALEIARWRAERDTAYRERRPWPIGPAITPTDGIGSEVA